jgi:hypothetical protein
MAKDLLVSQSLEARDHWIEEELAGCEFADVRHGKRLSKLLEKISFGQGSSMPWAFQDWANTKAAYRFFANVRVNEFAILGGHFQATRARFESARGAGPVLVLHDTTEFSYKREKTASIGLLKKVFLWRDKDGLPRNHTLCGLLMHSGLVVTTSGIPLGLASIKFWTRKKFKGTNALKKKINSTRVAIEQKESYRWVEGLQSATELLGMPEAIVHVCDRESDIYELFAAAQEAGTHFLFRTCVDRLTGDDRCRVSEVMSEVRVKGLHRIEVRDKKGNVSSAVLELRYRRLRILPPEGKKMRYPELDLTVLHAQERGTPQNREAVNWKLITDLPVTSRKQAIEKLHWYAMRWKIETFHKILKSGARAEEAKLRTASRLVNLIAVLCILSWRIFWMTMMNRIEPDADPRIAMTKTEIQLLGHAVHCKGRSSPPPETLHDALQLLAKLGGYLARVHDPPPGNLILWRGLGRLTDIQIGFLIAQRIVGK